MKTMEPTGSDWIHYANAATAPILRTSLAGGRSSGKAEAARRVSKLNDECHGCNGEHMIRQSGCSTCTECGFSACG